MVELWKTKRYSKEDRKTVRRMIKTYIFSGLTHIEIADELKKAGIKTPAGKEPDKYFVSNQAESIRAESKRRAKKRANKAAAVVTKPKVFRRKPSCLQKPVEAPEAEPVSLKGKPFSSMIDSIIENKEMTSAQKIKMIQAYRDTMF